MFTVLSAVAIVGGSIPLIKKSTGQDQKADRKPIKQDVDPATAALLAAKSLSLSLPQPISAHALSKVTTPPSILVPSHTPSPPVPDIQVLASLLAAGRKHALNHGGSQSIFVEEEEGLDMGVWIGPLNDGGIKEGDETWRKRAMACIIERLTNGKAEKNEVEELAIINPLPTTVAADAAHQKALSLLDVYIVFSLPPKDMKQAFFLVGRNTQTQNWIAIGAASEEKKVLDTSIDSESSVPKASWSPSTEANGGSDHGYERGGGSNETNIPERKQGKEAEEASLAPQVDNGRAKLKGTQPQQPEVSQREETHERQQINDQSGSRGRGRGGGRRRRRRRGRSGREGPAAAPTDARVPAV